MLLTPTNTIVVDNSRVNSYTIKIIHVDVANTLPNGNPKITESIEKTERKDVLTFAIEKLIEKYYKDRIVGQSNCSGRDFKVSIENGVATIKFCRTFMGVGTMSDATVVESIKATAKQFSTVREVRVIDMNGNCLFDASGLNTCIKAKNNERTIKVIHVDKTYLEPVISEFVETTTRRDVLTFAIEKLIEKYYKDLIIGPSNCFGKDFKVSIQNGVAIIQFCRIFMGIGTMGDATVLASIEATAKQFSNIKDVVILNSQGRCLFDESGWDTCLKKLK